MTQVLVEKVAQSMPARPVPTAVDLSHDLGHLGLDHFGTALGAPGDAEGWPQTDRVGPSRRLSPTRPEAAPVS